MMALGDRRWIRLFFGFGLAISVGMAALSQVAGDQLNLLGLGWRLAFEGDWPAHGNPTSAGGFTPGGLSALVVGLPLLVWQDHRAVAFLTLATHLLAYLLLDRLVRRILGPEERFLFAVFYWLNPWRLYHSAFIWNPNFLFLIGALHLWTAFRLRQRRSFWASFAHVAILGFGVQVAIHTLPLVVASLLLWWRGYLRLHVGGAAAATAVVAASLAPWMAAVAADPALLPTASGRWLFLLNTSGRALLYWLRYPSFALSAEPFCLDFRELAGPAIGARLAPVIAAVRPVLYLGTLPVALWANYRLWRGSGRWWRPASEVAGTESQWLVGVVRWSFMAALLTFALSPATVTRWHLQALLHLAVLPVVLAGGALLRGARAPLARRAVWAYAGVAVFGVTLLVGGPMYRCGGERCSTAATLPDLRHDHPMLVPLGIQRTCPVTVDDPDGWWIQTVAEPGDEAPPT